MYFGIMDNIRQFYYEWDSKRATKDLDKISDKLEKDAEELKKLVKYQDTLKWSSYCIHNADVYPELQKLIDSIKIETLDDMKEHAKVHVIAENGSRAAIAAFLAYFGKLKEGFFFWPQNIRLAQSSIHKYLGIPLLEEYDDIEDDDIPHITEYAELDNKHDIFIDDKTIEFAFRIASENDSTKKFVSNIKKGVFVILHSTGIKGEVLKPEEPKKNDIKTETPNNTYSGIKFVHEDDELDKPCPIHFFYDESKNDKQENDDKVTSAIKSFIKDSSIPNKFFIENFDEGITQVSFLENGKVYLILVFDPGTIIGNGINILGNVKIPDENGNEYIDHIFVNIEKDKDIAIKIVLDPNYVLTPDEHQKVLSRMFTNTHIYYYIDMSNMNDVYNTLSIADRDKFGKKLTAICNVMENGNLEKSRLRFLKYENLNHFTLVSDNNVKVPIPDECCSNVGNFVIKVSDDTIEVYTVDKEGSFIDTPAYTFSINYGEM